MMSLAGYELKVRNIDKGGTSWRPALFVAVIATNQGPTPIIGYLAESGHLSLLLGSGELRAVN